MKRGGLIVGAVVTVACLAWKWWSPDDWTEYRYVAGTAAAVTGPTRSPHGRYFIDFAGDSSGDNLRFALPADRQKLESFFDESVENSITLLHFTEQPVEFTTYSIFIEYVASVLRYATFYLSPQAVSYAEAVQVMDRFIKQAGLSNRFDTREYEKHMGKVEAKELWSPNIVLEHIEMSAMLNCDWEWNEAARDQLREVRCRPYIAVEPPDLRKIDAGQE
ncbi:MAG: hypothetical protein JWN04_4958 [Myxococcaceae bacterium]|nr:hypothetical protein [Myxococcaceae bacterium]